MMHRVDFLGRYVPEFGQLTCLVQHEFFHRYTADEHTLVCIDKLDQVMQTEDPKLRVVSRAISKNWRTLLFSISRFSCTIPAEPSGRGRIPRRARFSRRAPRSASSFPPAQRRSLILLVDHHLTLSNMAQQRNLDDPETAVEFARIVQDQKNLDALMLLTLADGQGTSADAWSDWKEIARLAALSRDLAISLRPGGVLRADEDRARAFAEAASRKSSAPITRRKSKRISNSCRTIISAPLRSEEIVSHLRLFRRFLENLYLRDEPPLAPAIAWQAFPEQGHSIASFCAWDGQELLAKIAGSFAVVPLNILSADIYTRGDNVVLDIFRVCDPKFRAVTDKRDQALVESTLRERARRTRISISRRCSIGRGGRIAKRASRHGMDFPTRVTVENKTHPTYTLIQIQTPDRLGLLYELLSAFGEERVSIALSRISTEKGAAIDTFYVADRATRGKITDPVPDRRVAGTAAAGRPRRRARANGTQITLARAALSV